MDISKLCFYRSFVLSLILQLLLLTLLIFYTRISIARFPKNKQKSLLYSYWYIIPNTVHLGDISAQSDLNKANLFNSYFHSVFTKSSFCCPNPHQLPDINPKLGHLSNTEEEVFHSLDPSKATGCDGIGPRLLKHCALALYHLFNLSISQSYIPSEWHLHLIKPLFKSGDRSLVQNYRLISLLCVTSKILEKIVFNHFLQFVQDKNISISVWLYASSVYSTKAAHSSTFHC